MAVEPQNKFLQDYFHVFGDQLTYKGNFRNKLIGGGGMGSEVMWRSLVRLTVQDCRGWLYGNSVCYVYVMP